MDPMQNSHVKLLAFDLLSLTRKPSSSSSSSSRSSSCSFYRKKSNRPVYRAEILGVVVSIEKKENKYMKFLIDDGTGCVPCILWLNHLDSRYYARHDPSNVQLKADIARAQAFEIKHGLLARVRGRITAYRGIIQITVSDVVIEKDPSFEMVHWLDCIKLARNCYDSSPPSTSISGLQK